VDWLRLRLAKVAALAHSLHHSFFTRRNRLMRKKVYLFLTACALVAATACVTALSTGGPAAEERGTPAQRIP
jgi:hypothetical protein